MAGSKAMPTGKEDALKTWAGAKSRISKTNLALETGASDGVRGDARTRKEGNFETSSRKQFCLRVGRDSSERNRRLGPGIKSKNCQSLLRLNTHTK